MNPKKEIFLNQLTIDTKQNKLFHNVSFHQLYYSDIELADFLFLG